MNGLLRIGNSEYSKTSDGVFEVPFCKLGITRFSDIPYESEIKIMQLPGNEETYNLSITAWNPGDPENSEFYLDVRISFSQKGETNDPIVIYKRDRKLRHIRNFIRGLVNSGIFDWHGDEIIIPKICLINYAKRFTRQENPIILQEVGPFVDRFKAFLEKPDIYLFLCHASEDKEFVDIFATYLDSRDVDLWYDKREIKVGDSIVNRINDGLDAASHLVVVLSKSSVKKPWVQKELSSALMKQLQDKSITIIPLLREDCKIPALLADIKYADCRENINAGFQQLVDDIFGSRDGITKKESLIRGQEKEIAMTGKVINFHSEVNKSIVGDNNQVTININKLPKKTSRNKYPEGCIGHDVIKDIYISYLIDRYHEFKEFEVGKEHMNYAIFPSNLKKKFKIGKQRTIYNVPIGRFDELAIYIQSRIDGTLLGKTNKRKGHKNYLTFEEYITANKINE
jgi:hypothetical protein